MSQARNDAAYVPQLDGLRALAVTAVILFHMNFTPVGWVGVPLFYVLSGFLITGILVRNADRPLREYLGTFYWRRTVRIFPPYYLYLFINACLVIRHHESLSEYGWFLSYLGNQYIGLNPTDVKGGAVVHLWSLAVEEQFYLVWPVLIYVFRKHVALLCIVTIMASIVIRSCIYWLTGNAWLTILTLPSCMDMLAAGGLAAVATNRSLILGPALLGFLLAGVGLVTVGYQGFAIPPTWVPIAPYMYTALGFLFAGLVKYAHLLRMLGWPPLRYVGRISYGIYLWHLLAIWAAAKITNDQNGRVALTFLLSVGVAALSWHFFEKPILRYKDRLPFPQPHNRATRDLLS